MRAADGVEDGLHDHCADDDDGQHDQRVDGAAGEHAVGDLEQIERYRQNQHVAGQREQHHDGQVPPDHAEPGLERGGKVDGPEALVEDAAATTAASTAVDVAAGRAVGAGQVLLGLDRAVVGVDHPGDRRRRVLHFGSCRLLRFGYAQFRGGRRWRDNGWRGRAGRFMRRGLRLCRNLEPWRRIGSLRSCVLGWLGLHTRNSPGGGRRWGALSRGVPLRRHRRPLDGGQSYRRMSNAWRGRAGRLLRYGTRPCRGLVPWRRIRSLRSCVLGWLGLHTRNSPGGGRRWGALSRGVPLRRHRRPLDGGQSCRRISHVRRDNAGDM